MRSQKELFIDLDQQYIDDEQPSKLFNKNSYQDFAELKFQEILNMDEKECEEKFSHLRSMASPEPNHW